MNYNQLSIICLSLISLNCVQSNPLEGKLLQLEDDLNYLPKPNGKELESFIELVKQFNETIETLVEQSNEINSMDNLLSYQDLINDSNQTINQLQFQQPQQQQGEFIREAVLAVMLQQLKGFFPGLDINRFELLAKVFANFWPSIRDFMRDNPNFFENIYKRLVPGNSSSDATINLTTTFSPEISF